MNELVQAQPRNYVIATLFFNHQLGSLAKATPGDANFKPSNIVGAVWDLYLATVHEKILGSSEPPNGDLAILCTRDAALANYCGRFPLRGLAVLTNGTYRIDAPWDDPWLRGLLGEQRWADLAERANNHDVGREQGLGDPERVVALARELQAKYDVPVQMRLIKDNTEEQIRWSRTFRD